MPKQTSTVVSEPVPALPTPRPHPAPGEAAVRVLRRFRMVFNAVKTHFQQVEKQAGMGGAQLWALSVIAAQPGLGVTALARAMDIHQTTASNLVRQLVARELVAMRRDGADRRTTQLHTTPTGEAALAQAPGPFAGVLPEALAALDESTLLRLESDLDRLLLRLQVDEGAAQTPLAQL